MAGQKETRVITMRTEYGEGIKLIKHENDVMVPIRLGDPGENLNAIAGLKYKPGDVMLCTYAKCGTHWVGQMLLKLEGIPIDPSKPPILLLDFEKVEDIASLAPPRVISTHLWSKRLPEDHVINGGKVILVVRNPKDVCVSMYHHFKKSAAFANKQTWEEFFTSFIEGSVPFGSYFEYLGAWSKELTGTDRRLNIAVFYYEDFIHDSTEQLSKLANFLGLERSEDVLRRIAEECSLDNLKEASRKGTEPKGLLDKDGISVIYRKGTVGDWKNHFTVAQNEQFDRILEEKQACKDFKFQY